MSFAPRDGGIRVACPRCGGTEYRLIAPGFVECIAMVGFPDPSSPRHELTARQCSARYHTTTPGSPAAAAGSAACACGLFAIGACPRCDTPYCGDHSWLRDGQRLCSNCAHAFDDQSAKSRAQAQEAHLAQVRASNARARTDLPALARKAFAARPDLVRTFIRGYHRGVVGRLSAPKALLIYAGTCYNRSSDDRDERSYCVDQSGDVYTVNFAYGPHFYADPCAADDARCATISGVLQSLIERAPMADNSDWYSWRHRK